MEKKKYYAITTKMTFEKTVLVPVDTVEDIDEAINMVDSLVEDGTIMVLMEDADCETVKSPYADENGIYEATDEIASLYDIIKGEVKEDSEQPKEGRLMKNATNQDIFGIIIKNEDGTFDVTTDFSLTEEETQTILDILTNHANEGGSSAGLDGEEMEEYLKNCRKAEYQKTSCRET